jgi:hypothetical protein
VLKSPAAIGSPTPAELVYDVRVAGLVLNKAHERYGEERSPAGSPSECDFVGGPLAAALLEFRHFDELPEVAGPSVRSLIITDPLFGALVFFGVLFEAATVEIADFEDDPDYWSMIDPLG